MTSKHRWVKWSFSTQHAHHCCSLTSNPPPKRVNIVDCVQCSWPLILLATVVQRPDNFIKWISHHPTVSICAKISVFPCVQVNMHALTTAKFGSVRKLWTTFNMKVYFRPWIVPYPLDKVIRPLNNWGLDYRLYLQAEFFEAWSVVMQVNYIVPWQHSQFPGLALSLFNIHLVRERLFGQ